MKIMSFVNSFLHFAQPSSPEQSGKPHNPPWYSIRFGYQEKIAPSWEVLMLEKLSG
jgi:hypothetical protein